MSWESAELKRRKERTAIIAGLNRDHIPWLRRYKLPKNYQTPMNIYGGAVFKYQYYPVILRGARCSMLARRRSCGELARDYVLRALRLLGKDLYLFGPPSWQDKTVQKILRAAHERWPSEVTTYKMFDRETCIIGGRVYHVWEEDRMNVMRDLHNAILKLTPRKS